MNPLILRKHLIWRKHWQSQTAVPECWNLGGLAYWLEGAAVALFFRDNVERTVVPVYTLGKVLDDVRIFEEYEGGIKITRLSIN